jgi:hypothetical protein
VLEALPKSVHGRVKKAVREKTEAENKAEAKEVLKGFEEEFGVKWPRAVAKVTNEEEALLTYYDYPVEHWVHLRTTNPIESPFATLRAKTNITRGPGRPGGDDLQAVGSGRGEMEGARRLPTCRSGEGRSQVRERGVGGKNRGEGRCVIGTRSTSFDYTS